jgi:two-component system phosphate regulon sensor histidine kinase PhoR
MPLDWNPIIHSVVSRSEDAMGQKSLKLKLNLAPNPVLVMGDREAMIQVLDNLLTNAIKYTPEGGLLTITFSQKSPWAQIDVEDTGIGIPEEHLARIFERFYRVDKARSREMGGTGLGLSIVKHLVSGMGGEVTVTSTVGVGSIFSIRLRLSVPQSVHII